MKYSFSTHSTCGFNIKWSPLSCFEKFRCKKECDEEDSIILAGTTNTDGTGSATNLSLDNADIYLVGEGEIIQDDIVVIQSDEDGGSTYVVPTFWNKDATGFGYKEVKVTNDDAVVFVAGVVDVDINNCYNYGSQITVVDAKRGEIHTGKGDDTINVTILSNNTLWSNHFEIDTGKGSDTITLQAFQNSQNTSYTIDAGRGHDVIDVASLSPASDDPSLDIVRSVDGGRGLDALLLGDTQNTTFSNFEALIGNGTTSLMIDESMLENNGSKWLGLVIANCDIEFSDGLSVESVSASLSSVETQFVDSFDSIALSLAKTAADFSVVEINNGDQSYSLLVDDISAFI
ncbi:hypothetical protein [Vibrio hippocampi]|uniref:Uncharacterized protein n=1 Tax=Vibrio hippocampi TaxID=654686 RepID=A0ABM8ZMU5_9VIBR|nr:hypothetical protein [Vibrio hippocampi]CAH0529072.1 hypothetical protein VHP8226_03036 [Vibrio hippocampi]